MDITITPAPLHGTIPIIPSKSQAHRLLIASAFADAPTHLICAETNRDIEATADCLRALGASVCRTTDGYTVLPIRNIPSRADLPCGESGSTLRFLLPIAGALGVDAVFHMQGRLPDRPLSPLWEEMERMGCTLSRPTSDSVSCCGKLKSGEFIISGSVSSQYITGLLFAAALLKRDSRLTLTDTLESAPYVRMTQQVLTQFGVDTKDFFIRGGQSLHSPGTVTVEGDWSNGAFFLAANALGSELTLLGLDRDSTQGDRAAVNLLSELQNGHSQIDASDIPDLVPILSIVAAQNHGAHFTGIRRLRLKESDRVASVIAMLTALGGKAEADENTLRVFPIPLTGGTVDSFRDHRIAMSAAIAATQCTRKVTIIDAQCVEKSYPNFWTLYAQSGGHYEQHLR